MANNLAIDGTLSVAGNMSMNGGANIIGSTNSQSVGFYGGAGATQRAGSNQASTNVVTSASFGTLQVAHMQEIYQTLTGLSLWKGSA